MPTKQRYFIPLLLGVFALAGLGGAVAPGVAHAAMSEEYDFGTSGTFPAYNDGTNPWTWSIYDGDVSADVIANTCMGYGRRYNGGPYPGDPYTMSDFFTYGGPTDIPAGTYTFTLHGNDFCDGGYGHARYQSYYQVVYWDGSAIVPPTPPDTSSRIDSITIATSTNTVNVTGYWSYASSTVYDSLLLEQSSQHLPLEYLPDFYSNGELLATTTGAFNLTFAYTPLPTFAGTGTSTLPIKDALTITAKLFHTDKTNFNCDSIFPIANDDGSITECDPQSHALVDSKSATIADGTIGYQDITTSAGLQQLPEYECGLTALSGCLKNAFIFLFYPAGDTVAQFNTLTLSDRFPFAYAYQVSTIRNAIFNSPQTASSTIQVSTPIGDMTFLSASMMAAVPFASLIKTLLSAVMWFMCVLVIYRRVLASHDNTTHV